MLDHDSPDGKKAKEREERRMKRKRGIQWRTKIRRAYLVRMRTRAFSNRNVVFLLSQVSHLRWKKGKNRVKVQEE